MYGISNIFITKDIGVLFAGVAMVGGMWFVFDEMKKRQQGFTQNSLKALGIVLFIPTLLVVGIAIPEFKGEPLAALLGTVAGYVLSQSKSDEK